MKEKLNSLLPWRPELPFIMQIRAASRQFSETEKRIFLACFALFLAGIIGTVISINNKYSVVVPDHGGKWREGVVGSSNFMNPVLAVSDADRDMTALIFSGLMRFDGHGGLIPDLAESFETSDDGLTYTFRLKENLQWHDGKPLTSRDIIFTVETIRNQAIKSPLRANWEGVTLEAPDDRTIIFSLKKPYAPFLENAALGILPRHIWNGILPEQFTFSVFNREPVGSGPYKIKNISKNSFGLVEKYSLAAYNKYAGGEPYISTLEIKFYPAESALISAYTKGGIDGMSIASPKSSGKLTRKNSVIHRLALPRIFAVFLNQNRVPAFAEKGVRIALSQAIDKKTIINEIFGGHAEKINSPIPPGTFGAVTEDPAETEAAPTQTASSTFKSAGWLIDPKTGILSKKTKKETKKLSFTLATANTPDLANTAELLKTMWKPLGIDVTIKLFEIGDLNQQVIRPREYDTLLFGEVVGRDPDPFAFWHSSQRNDPGLNIALYANSTVDKLLESARKTINEEERKQQYAEFQEEIAKDMPAIFLYSPFYLYVTDENLRGFETKNIITPSERFATIHLWHLKTKKVLKYFAR